VWMGWLTLKTKAGITNLEPVSAQSPVARPPPATPPEAADSGAAPRAPTTPAAPAEPGEPSGTALVLLSNRAPCADADLVSAPGGAGAGAGAADSEVDRVLRAPHAFATLELPVAPTEDLAGVRKLFRRISLAVHPDKSAHPKADAAFRKVFGAFEAVCDLGRQKAILAEVLAREARAALSEDLAGIQAAVDAAGNGDEDEDEAGDDEADEVDW
jgi:hypothetical protein